MSSTGSNQPHTMTGLDINGFFPTWEQLTRNAIARAEWEEAHQNDPGAFTVEYIDAETIKDTCRHVHTSRKNAQPCLDRMDPDMYGDAIIVDLADGFYWRERRWFKG